MNEMLLLAAIALSVFFTLFLKTFPVTALKGGNFPALARQWLEFVPVSVMAALVGPDIFIYEGQFNIGTSNLFLMVSIPTFLVAWIWKNYFVTIAFGLALLIAARYFSLA